MTQASSFDTEDGSKERATIFMFKFITGTYLVDKYIFLGVISEKKDLKNT